MSIESLMSAFSRLLFALATLLFVLAGLEKAANMTGQTLTFIDYAPGRLLEFAGIMLLFVIAMTLRRIRKDLSDQRD